MDKQKQKKFAELYEKFVKKCVQEGMFPVAILRTDISGIIPAIDFYEMSEEEQKNALSSLNKKK